MRPLGYSLPYLGYLSQADVEPRRLLTPGLLAGAVGLILFQQRPTDDPSPEVVDIRVSESVRDAGEVVGVRLLDHLLLGQGDRWVSLRRQRKLRFHGLGEDVTLPMLAQAAPQVDRRQKVKPKYVNPARPSETWSGRGRMARWLRDKLAAGARLEDFLADL